MPLEFNLGKRRQQLAIEPVAPGEAVTEYDQHLLVESLVVNKQWEELFKLLDSNSIPIQSSLARFLRVPRVSKAFVKTVPASDLPQIFFTSPVTVRSAILYTLRLTPSRIHVAAIWEKATIREKSVLINSAENLPSIVVNRTLPLTYLEPNKLPLDVLQSVFSALLDYLVSDNVFSLTHFLQDYKFLLLYCVRQKALSSLADDFTTRLGLYHADDALSYLSNDILSVLFFRNPDLFITSVIPKVTDDLLLLDNVRAILPRVSLETRSIIIDRLAEIDLSFDVGNHLSTSRKFPFSGYKTTVFHGQNGHLLGLTFEEIQYLCTKSLEQLAKLSAIDLVNYPIFTNSDSCLFHPETPFEFYQSAVEFLITAAESELSAVKVFTTNSQVVIWSLLYNFQNLLPEGLCEYVKSCRFIYSNVAGTRAFGFACLIQSSTLMAQKSTSFLIEALNLAKTRAGKCTQSIIDIMKTASSVLPVKYVWGHENSGEIALLLEEMYVTWSFWSEVSAILPTMQKFIIPLLTLPIVHPGVEQLLSDFVCSLCDLMADNNIEMRDTGTFIHHVDYCKLKAHKLTRRQLEKKKMIFPEACSLERSKFHVMIASSVINYCLSKHSYPVVPNDNDILAHLRKIDSSASRPNPNRSGLFGRSSPVKECYQSILCGIINAMDLHIPAFNEERINEIKKCIENERPIKSDEARDAEVIYNSSVNLVKELNSAFDRKLNNLLKPPLSTEVKLEEEKEKEEVETLKIEQQRKPPHVPSAKLNKMIGKLIISDPSAFIDQVCSVTESVVKSDFKDFFKCKLLLCNLQKVLKNKALCFSNFELDYLKKFMRYVFLELSSHPELLGKPTPQSVSSSSSSARASRGGISISRLRGRRTASLPRRRPTTKKKTDDNKPCSFIYQLFNRVCAILAIIPDFQLDETIIGDYEDNLEELKKDKSITIPKKDDVNYSKFVMQYESGFGLIYLLQSFKSINNLRGFYGAANLMKRFIVESELVRDLVKTGLETSVVAPALTSALNWQLDRHTIKQSESRQLLTTFIQSLLEQNIGVTALKGVLRLIPKLAIPGHVSAAELLERIWKRPKVNVDARALIVNLAFEVLNTIPTDPAKRNDDETKDFNAIKNILRHASKLANQEPIAQELYECLQKVERGFEVFVASSCVRMLEKVPASMLVSVENQFYQFQNPRIDCHLVSHNIKRISEFDFQNACDLKSNVASLIRSHSLECKKATLTAFAKAFGSFVQVLVDHIGKLSGNSSDSFDPFNPLLDIAIGISTTVNKSGLENGKQFASELKKVTEKLLNPYKFTYFIDLELFNVMLSSIDLLPFSSSSENALKFIISLLGIDGQFYDQVFYFFKATVSKDQISMFPFDEIVDFIKGQAPESFVAEFSDVLHGSSSIYKMLYYYKKLDFAATNEILKSNDLSFEVRRYLTNLVLSCQADRSVSSFSHLF
ncbi:hypothetical protein P9112_008563 [Eukaryota sp. TZLM1-RC]